MHVFKKYTFPRKTLVGDKQLNSFVDNTNKNFSRNRKIFFIRILQKGVIQYRQRRAKVFQKYSLVVKRSEREGKEERDCWFVAKWKFVSTTDYHSAVNPDQAGVLFPSQRDLLFALTWPDNYFFFFFSTLSVIFELCVDFLLVLINVKGAKSMKNH